MTTRGESPVAVGLGPVRIVVGLANVVAPNLLAVRILDRPLGAGERQVARVLGIRQVLQAMASGRHPTAPVLRLGVGIDTTHAASMFGLALASPDHRRIALASAVLATGFACAGAWAAHSIESAHGESAPGSSDFRSAPTPRD